MTSRFDGLASSCDHSSIFSLTYLRVTSSARHDRGPFFDDTPFVNERGHAVRALLLRRLRLVGGGTDRASPAGLAGRIRRGEVACGLGNGRPPARDQRARAARPAPRALPVGLLAPTGVRKADHDRVDIILNRVADDITAEIARRFDPTVDDSNLPTSIDDAASSSRWRHGEKAWRSAALPAAAPTPEARGLLAVAAVEQDAAAEAQAIVAAQRYPPLIGGGAARDAFCAVHHDDA